MKNLGAILALLVVFSTPFAYAQEADPAPEKESSVVGISESSSASITAEPTDEAPAPELTKEAPALEPSEGQNSGEEVVVPPPYRDRGAES